MSEAVREMFDGIAPRYDRANSVLSFGQHQRWRRRLVKMVAPRAGDSVLDVATGTGDLAFLFRRAVGAKGRVVGLDFSPAMIDIATAKAQRMGAEVEFRVGDALRLPFPDASFEQASIAFGIRNLDDPRRGLAEMARVVRPGGHVAVLEFGQPQGILGPFYRFYSRRVLPRVGGRITGQRAAYEYLDRTAAAFPSGSAFVEMMASLPRLGGIRVKRLTGGIVYAYVATVQ